LQDEEITNEPNISDFLRGRAGGRVLALDIGTKRVGIAVCDELQITVRPLPVIKRQSWKELLKRIVSLIKEFDAVALVLGLPYNFDGSESEMSREARRLARNFSLSLAIPVFLQDERLTSRSAEQRLYDKGFNPMQIRERIDSEAATIILSDFLELKSSIERKENINRERQDEQNKSK